MSELNEDTRVVNYTPDDDLVQPFLIERTGIRGRLVRLGPVLDTILARAELPRPVAALLGELVGLGCLLGSTLKYDGVFTLQVKADGALKTMVTDMTSAGSLRGYASYDTEKVARLQETESDLPADITSWLGEGYMAFTVDQGQHSERYQGMVELQGPRLADSLRHYFRQSQQINAGILVAVRQTDNGWRGGALLIERIPDSATGDVSEISDEDWRHSLILMSSCTEEELLAPELSAERLIYRLFHEDGVRVFGPKSFDATCRCSHEKVVNVLKSLPSEQIRELSHEDGSVSMKCEFCSTNYHFSESELEALFREAAGEQDYR